MRLKKFESSGQEPIGEGIQKKVFVNPDDEGKVISVMKKEEYIDKETPRQIKGRYYLTKIAHLLLPKNIPDVYQAGEDTEGTQTVDAERISHTEEHALYQKIRNSHENGDLSLARDQLTREMGAESDNLDFKLRRTGLFNSIDTNIANYTKDKNGNVYYLETLPPWRPSRSYGNDVEVLFDEEKLRNTINDVPDQKIKEKCAKYLDRLLILLDEEKGEAQKKLG